MQHRYRRSRGYTNSIKNRPCPSYPCTSHIYNFTLNPSDNQIFSRVFSSQEQFLEIFPNEPKKIINVEQPFSFQILKWPVSIQCDHLHHHTQFDWVLIIYSSAWLFMLTKYKHSLRHIFLKNFTTLLLSSFTSTSPYLSTTQIDQLKVVP